MSGDWIKMEKSLWSDPKVVRIMSACKADKCPVIGALFHFWSIADTHTTDGFLFGYTPQILDSEVAIPGFSEALASVSWLIINETGLQVPDFKEHMGKSAKRRAKDAKRKKGVREDSAKTPQKKRTKRGPDKSRLDISIPDGIDKDSWQRFFDYRQAMPKRNQLTEEACRISFELLAKYPPEIQKQIIDKTIMSGWTGLFDPKGGANGAHKQSGQHLTPVQRVEKAFAERGADALEGGGADLR
jgi:hypothetical protein